MFVQLLFQIVVYSIEHGLLKVKHAILSKSHKNLNLISGFGRCGREKIK